jgi:hypothetical protein
LDQARPAISHRCRWLDESIKIGRCIRNHSGILTDRRNQIINIESLECVPAADVSCDIPHRNPYHAGPFILEGA